MRKVIVIPIDELNITAIIDGNEIMLVDCGYPGSLERIEQALHQESCSLIGLRQIIITHHDQDHIGGLRDIVDRYPKVEVLSSAEQIPYITGQKKSLRLVQMEEICKTLPKDQKEENLQYQKFIASVRSVDKVTKVQPGQILPFYGGIQILDTAGHHPGHISVYIPSEKTLVAGDALVISEEGLGANPAYTFDMPTAVKSAKTLLDYDIEKIICYHGGVFSGDVKSALQYMIQRQG